MLPGEPLHQPLPPKAACSAPSSWYLHHDVLRPQEWIKDTQNVSQGSRSEDREQDPGREEAFLVLLPKAEEEAPRTPTRGSPCQPAQKAAPEEPSQPPGQGPQGDRLSLRGFTFEMSEDSYVTL